MEHVGLTHTVFCVTCIICDTHFSSFLVKSCSFTILTKEEMIHMLIQHRHFVALSIALSNLLNVLLFCL